MQMLLVYTLLPLFKRKYRKLCLSHYQYQIEINRIQSGKSSSRHSNPGLLVFTRGQKRNTDKPRLGATREVLSVIEPFGVTIQMFDTILRATKIFIPITVVLTTLSISNRNVSQVFLLSARIRWLLIRLAINFFKSLFVKNLIFLGEGAEKILCNIGIL